MTFREFMAENNYELLTTFWDDFSIADRFGVSAVRDTFNRAFAEWKEDYQYLTELILVLNHKIWQHYEKRNWWHFINPFGSRPTGTPWSICKATS